MTEPSHRSGAAGRPTVTVGVPRTPRVHVLSASRLVDAPAARVYGILADYREGHPSILPRPPFSSLDVEEGGQGEGTVIRVEMVVMGRRQAFRARVSEPEPGRTLVETNDTGYTTTFTVDPVDACRSQVTLSTDAEPRGLLGAFERWTVARLLRPVYEQELERLNQVATAPVSAAGPEPPPGR